MDLSTPFGKLGRALEHQHKLGEMQREYRASNPIEYSHYANLEDTTSPLVSMQWRVRRFEPLSDWWGYVSGDMINNMRAALDHAMLLTAKRFRELSEQQERRVQFPIISDADEWQRWRRKNEYKLDQEALDAIEQAQPIRVEGDDEGGLALLGRLANVDKHRRILTHAMSRPAVTVEADPPLEIVSAKYTNEPLREGLTLATIKYKRPARGDVVDMQMSAEYYEVISLDNGRHLPLAFTMHIMFTAAFNAVADLLAPVANEIDVWFVRSVMDEEESNRRIVLRAFMNEADAAAWEAAHVDD